MATTSRLSTEAPSWADSAGGVTVTAHAFDRAEERLGIRLDRQTLREIHQQVVSGAPRVPDRDGAERVLVKLLGREFIVVIGPFGHVLTVFPAVPHDDELPPLWARRPKRIPARARRRSKRRTW
jgi:hypothetical protein